MFALRLPRPLHKIPDFRTTNLTMFALRRCSFTYRHSRIDTYQLDHVRVETFRNHERVRMGYYYQLDHVRVETVYKTHTPTMVGSLPT